ncbi:MAG: hypothetical protein JWP31_1260, partial [Aeromicrobium sp.]|nr:hypothetical protein [Aeromicrobium sp.]
DVDQLAESFDSVSKTFANTAPELRQALDGVGELSKSISSRDAELRTLLRRANGVSSVLSDRSAEITRILQSGAQLFEELDARRLVIHELLVNSRRAASQLTGLVDDNNKQIKPLLRDLRTTIKVLNDNEANIESVLDGYPRYARSLGEAVGGGPFFYAFVENLVAPVDLAPVLPELIRREEP